MFRSRPAAILSSAPAPKHCWHQAETETSAAEVLQNPGTQQEPGSPAPSPFGAVWAPPFGRGCPARQRSPRKGTRHSASALLKERYRVKSFRIKSKEAKGGGKKNRKITSGSPFGEKNRQKNTLYSAWAAPAARQRCEQNAPRSRRKSQGFSCLN